MGESAKAARKELEELYSGIPDDSVNLTFGDLAEVRQQQQPPPATTANSHKDPTKLDRKNSRPFDPITEASPRREEVTPLAKLPSLDFSRGLEASAAAANYNYHLMHHNNHHPLHTVNYNSQMMNHNHLHNTGGAGGLDQKAAGQHHHYGHGGSKGARPPPHPQHHHHVAVGSPYGTSHHSMSAYDDMSQMSGFPERGGRRRPGIPHSNICTICSTYIYLFRHRCLVCGRVYCRQCVNVGMGDMSEGRKCVECLGRRFSPRYIQKAGQTGCCMGYPSQVKQQELKWAEKGPRGSGENRQGRSERMSRPISPRSMGPAHGYNRHTKSPASFVSNTQGSFVVGSPSPYSPYYSPRNHPMPF